MNRPTCPQGTALVAALALTLQLAPLFTSTCSALPSATSDLSGLLSFEEAHDGSTIRGWGGGPATTIFADHTVVHGGAWSARLERGTGSAGEFSTVSQGVAIDFGGRQVQLRGFLRLEGVQGFAGLWLREDGAAQPLAFDNMQSRHLNGTRDWEEYTITLPLEPKARNLAFGCLLSGEGKVWVDDLQLLVDGTPVWQAPKVVHVPTAVDTDREFDRGSRVALTSLSPLQVANLTTLGEVWGFLKYHHPAVVTGKKHWDYELFRAMPPVLAAPNRAAANAAMVRWIDGLGAVDLCTGCATLDTRELAIRPDLDWIADETRLGPELSRRLRAIHHDRLTSQQFYVGFEVGVGNPNFDSESSYADLKLPDAGFQILGLFRFWNIVAYWFPYRDILDEDWRRVLTEHLPRVALAKSADEYQLALMQVVALVHDTHANLWSSLAVRPPTGACRLPVEARFVENQPVVAAYLDSTSGPATGLEIGDAIEAIDGTPTSALLERWAPYYGASNTAARLRDMARSLTRGPCADVRLRIRRAGRTRDVVTRRIPPPPSVGAPVIGVQDRPGPTFLLLSPNVAYLKLSTVRAADIDRYLDAAKDTKALIVDIRNYPAESVITALGGRLVEKPSPFASFTTGDATNPGAFHWVHTQMLYPRLPRYTGRIAILVDETTQSHAEFTTMALRTAPGAVVVGSTTAGADGNVSPIPLPGGSRAMISGIGVFYPDKRPTQGVGIVPDVEAHPTIAGLRAGRDEVLEAALRRVLGPDVSAAEIQRLARR